MEQRFNCTRIDLWWLKCSKIVFGRGRCYPDPLVGWGGDTPSALPTPSTPVGISFVLQPKPPSGSYLSGYATAGLRLFLEQPWNLIVETVYSTGNTTLLNNIKVAIAHTKPSVSALLETLRKVMCGSEAYGRIAHWWQKKFIFLAFGVSMLFYSADEMCILTLKSKDIIFFCHR